MQTQKQTHETFIQRVAELAIQRVPIEKREPFKGIKLVYGAGAAGTRGVTYYNRWKPGERETSAVPFVEVAAFGQEGWVQLAGTTIHELGHVLAGPMAGHDRTWKEACELLGLRLAKAAGMNYTLAALDPGLRVRIAKLAKPDEGAPVTDLTGLLGGLFTRRLRTCQAGRGTHGGKSFGPGSGSRLRRYICECVEPVIIRAARDDLAATCDLCNAHFHRG